MKTMKTQTNRIIGLGMLAMLVLCVVLPAVSNAQTSTTPPVLYWKLNETAGATTVVDKMGNFPGTVTGATLGAAGKDATGATFVYNTTNAIRSAVNPVFGSSSFTVSTWVFQNDTGATVQGLTVASTRPGSSGFMWYANNNAGNVDTISFNIWNTVTNGWNTILPSNVTRGAWHHVVETYDRNTATHTVYVDGALAPVVSGTNPATGVGYLPAQGTNRRVSLGRRSDDGYPAFGGMLDDFQYYDYALTADDVTYLYNNPGKAIATTGDPSLAVYPLALGTIKTQKTATGSVTVTNAGDSNTLNISGAQFISGDSSLFSVVSFPSTLAPHQAGQIVVTYSPVTNVGSHSAQLAIASNDPVVPVRSVNVTGSAFNTGLTGHFRMSEAAGTQMTDSSSLANHGTYFLNPTLNDPDVPAGSAAGQKSVVFVTGAGTDYGTIPDHNAYRSKEFTVSYWVNASTQPAAGNFWMPLSWYSLSQSGWLQYFYNAAPNGVCTGWGNYGARAVAAPYQGVIPSLSQWYHKVVTYRTLGTTTVASCYLNGVYQGNWAGTIPYRPYPDTPTPLYVAQRVDGSGQLDGRMTDVQFYNVFLGGTDVNWLYTHPGTALTPTNFAPAWLNTIGATWLRVKPGDTLPNVALGTVYDTEDSSASLLVRATSTFATLRNIRNVAGVVTADIATSPTMPVGLNAIQVEVVDSQGAFCPQAVNLYAPYGLASHWPLDDAVGSTVMADSKGRWNGSWTATAPTLENTDVPFGSGTNKSVTGFTNSAYGIIPSRPILYQNAFSISLWMKARTPITADPDPPVPLFLRAGDNNWCFYTWKAGSWSWNFWTGAWKGAGTVAPHPAWDVWHHCVLTYDGSKGKMYVDGVKAPTEASVPYSSWILNRAAPLLVGWQYQPGTIDDIMFFDVAIGPSTVQWLYTHGGQEPASLPPSVSYVMPTLYLMRAEPFSGLLATVYDVESLNSTITVVPAAGNPAGFTITNIVNNNGQISATIKAEASVAPGAYTLSFTATDPDGGSTTADLPVWVYYGLVSHWKLDEAASTDPLLDSKDGRNGRYTPEVVVNQPGMVGTSAQFDSALLTSATVMLWDDPSNPNGAALNGAFRQNRFTVSFWAAGNPTGAQQPLVSDHMPLDGGNQNHGWEFFYRNDAAYFHICSGGGGDSGAIVGTPTNAWWHHYAGVFSGSQALFYMDGVLVGSANVGTYSMTPYWLGGNYYNVVSKLQLGWDFAANGGSWVTTRYTTASIDDVMYFDVALTAAQIAKLYNARTGDNYDAYAPVLLFNPSPLDFGSDTPQGLTKDLALTAQNRGLTTVQLHSMKPTGASAAAYAVKTPTPSDPFNPDIAMAPGADTNFTISFTPASDYVVYRNAQLLLNYTIPAGQSETIKLFGAGTLTLVPGANPTVVISKAANQPSTTACKPVAFDVVFSEPVTGFTPSDVTWSGTVTSPSLTLAVAPTDSTGAMYQLLVTDVNAAITTGTLMPAVKAGAALSPTLRPTLASTGAPSVLWDKRLLGVSIYSGDGPVADLTTVTYTLRFSQSVMELPTSLLSLAGSAAGGASIAHVLMTNPSTAWQVEIAAGSLDGTLVLALADDDSIISSTGAKPLNGAGSGVIHGNPLVLDHTGAEVVSVKRANNAPRGAAAGQQVVFEVTFSDVVTDVDEADLLTVPSDNGASIVRALGAGNRWFVIADPGTNVGSFRIGAQPTATITNAAGLAFAGGTPDPDEDFFILSGPLPPTAVDPNWMLY